jgi:hypothetical protein
METMIISLNNVNHLIFAMVKCGVLFEVWTETLNIIQTIFGFKGLIKSVKTFGSGIFRRTDTVSLVYLFFVHCVQNRA